MEYIKYPRTPHLPYSQSKTDDDKTLPSDEHFFLMEEVVVTIKMDGENATIYPNGYIHARSIDGNNHPWQKDIKAISANWFYLIPEGYRICGENLQATHSIAYTFDKREKLFQCFAIYDNLNNSLSWDNVEKMCKDFGIETVPVIYRGPYNKEKILSTFESYCKSKEPEEVEGFVVRNANTFSYDDFSNNMAKYVRKNHIQTNKDWTKTWKSNIIKK